MKKYLRKGKLRKGYPSQVSKGKKTGDIHEKAWCHMTLSHSLGEPSEPRRKNEVSGHDHLDVGEKEGMA